MAAVCSARSSQTKNEGTTTRLLRAARIAENNSARGDHFRDIVREIRDDHQRAADDSIQSTALRNRFSAFVETECLLLISILESVQEIEELSPKAENKIISKGEKLAGQFLATLLEDRGIASQFVDLSDLIKRRRLHISINMPERQLYAVLSAAVHKEILDCGDKVPVVTGYFGNLPGGLLRVIGRGFVSQPRSLNMN